MRTSLTISFVLALAACKSDPSPPRSVAAPPPPAPTTVGVPGSQDLAPLAHLGARLHEESAHRPRVDVPAERVFRALADRGVAFASEKQVLATTAHASYCALGVTAETVAIAVCEYPSPEAAAAGKRLLDTHYAKLVPDAVRAVNGNTLVTIANSHRHPEIRDQVLATFQSL